MKKWLRRLCWTVGILLTIIIILVVGLQIFLDSGKFRQMVDEAAAEAIDGSLRYSRIKVSLIKTFPNIALEVDSLSITYPHEKFSEYDGKGVRSRLLSAGRGEQEDTLVSVGSISASVNPWRFLGGTIRVNHLRVDRPRAYLHKYTDDASNLDIFRSSGDTTESGPFSLPWLSIGEVSIDGRPRVVYTSQSDTVYAGIRFRRMALSGKVRIKEDKAASKIRHLDFRLDTLHVYGRLPADTLMLALDSLSLKAPRTNLLDLGLGARFRYRSPSLGRLEIPLRLSSLLGFSKKGDCMRLDLHSLDADLARIPIKASGLAELYDDYSYVDAGASIEDGDLGAFLKQYAGNFFDDADDIWTDAHINLGVSAKGKISEKENPAVEASLTIPEGSIKYYPKSLLARLSLDAGGSYTPEGRLSANLRQLRLSSDMLRLKASGSGSDLLGRNASVNGTLDASAVLEKIVRLLPDNTFAASGNVDMACNFKSRLSELSDFNFEKTRIEGDLKADKVDVALIQSGMRAHLRRPDIKVGNDSDGIKLSSLVDSLAYDDGADTRANIRKFGMNADIRKVIVNGEPSPHVVITNTDDKIFIRSGDSRIRLRNASIGLQADRRERRSNPQRERRRHVLDSLRRLYPGAPRDSIFALAGFKRRGLDEFASKDFKLELDASLLKLYDEWKPGGMIAAENVRVFSPSLPLRTRVNNISASLDDDDATIIGLDAKCGSSDIKLSGDMGGLRRFLRGRAPLKFTFNLDSDRINLNEIMLAMQKSQSDTTVVSSSETDEGFVLEGLEDSEYQGGMDMKAVIVPRNLSGSINLKAKRIDYTSVTVSPVVGQLNIDKRILQIKELKADTNLGSVDLDAFYATKSKDDISLGLDVHLNNMPVYDIIHMMPTVDEMMPVIKSFQGNVDFVASATTQLDTNMAPIMSSLNGLVRIGGEDLYVKNAGSLRKITRLMLLKNKNIGQIRNLYVDATFGDGKIDIYPFVLGIEKYTLAMSGTQHFNGKLKYDVSVLESIIPFRFGIKLRGSLDNWRFRLGRSAYKSVKRVPQYGPQLDTMGMNILYSIRNVFNDGVDSAMTRISMDRLFRERMGRDSGLSVEEADALMGSDEFYQVDSAVFAARIAEEDMELSAEIDALLEKTMSEAEYLQAEWEAKHPWAARAIKREEQKALERQAASAKKEE